MNAIELKKSVIRFFFVFFPFPLGFLHSLLPSSLRKPTDCGFYDVLLQNVSTQFPQQYKGVVQLYSSSVIPLQTSFFLSLGCAIFQNGSQEFQNDLQNPRLNVHFCCCCYLRPGVCEAIEARFSPLVNFSGIFFSCTTAS